MKNRILAALLALVLGVPLYLLAADAVPTAAAKTVSSAAPAQAVALLKALPSAEDLAAAMTPETDAAAMIAQTRADLQREIERQTGPKGIDLSWWQSHYNDIIGYIYSPGTPISYPIAYDGNNEYYLHHDLYGNYSEYGTIFLDARVPSDYTLTGLAIAALAGVILNAVLPGNDYEFGKSVEGDASADLGSY